MHSQASFDFTAPPTPPAGEVEALVFHLQQNPGFHTAKDLSAYFKISDRKIRQLAEAANGLVVSGPGSPGYIHLHHCPAKQLAHIAETLISQGRAMIKRGLKTRKRAHTLIR